MEKVTFGMENCWWNKTVLLSERELTAMAGGTGMGVCWLREKGSIYVPVSFLDTLLGRFLFDIKRTHVEMASLLL